MVREVWCLAAKASESLTTANESIIYACSEGDISQDAERRLHKD